MITEENCVLVLNEAKPHNFFCFSNPLATFWYLDSILYPFCISLTLPGDNVSMQCEKLWNTCNAYQADGRSLRAIWAVLCRTHSLDGGYGLSKIWLIAAIVVIKIIPCWLNSAWHILKWIHVLISGLFCEAREKCNYLAEKIMNMKTKGFLDRWQVRY